MNKLAKTGYVVISTYYTTDRQIRSITASNCMFPSQKKAQEWIMSAKGSLVKKSIKYAEARNMSIELLKMDEDGFNYLIEVVDGDERYPSIQYTITPVKYLDGGIG